MDLELNLQQYMTIVDNLPDLVEIITLPHNLQDDIFILLQRETNLKKVTFCMNPHAMRDEVNLGTLNNFKNSRWRIEIDPTNVEHLDEFRTADVLTAGGNSYYTTLYCNLITFVRIE